MRTIQLTQGQVTLVNDEDYELLAVYRWRAQWCHETRSYYAMRWTPKNTDGQRNALAMHRVIVSAVGRDEVDHGDHNTLNNQRWNLRLCSKSQNQGNQRLLDRNSSGRKGVYWYKSTNRWKAQIGINGRRKHLGYFIDLDDAARAYDAAAIEHFGQFALTNSTLAINTR